MSSYSHSSSIVHSSTIKSVSGLVLYVLSGNEKEEMAIKKKQEYVYSDGTQGQDTSPLSSCSSAAEEESIILHSREVYSTNNVLFLPPSQRPHAIYTERGYVIIDLLPTMHVLIVVEGETTGSSHTTLWW